MKAEGLVGEQGNTAWGLQLKFMGGCVQKAPPSALKREQDAVEGRAVLTPSHRAIKCRVI